MKKSVVVILTGFILLVSVIASANFELREEKLSQTLSEQKSQNNKEYVVKNYNGYVSVFKGESSFPMLKTDTPVNSLPYDDQEKLKSGILIQSDTSLRKCLEDYCS